MNLLQSAITPIAPTLYANMGGPRSRTRTMIVSSSLLGNDDGLVNCPRVIRLGLEFEDAHPVDSVEAILLAEGFWVPECLRDKFVLPPGRLICRPAPPSAERLSIHSDDIEDVLCQALMLGLCTAQVFDPQRPVLWTETSLTRVVELFDPTGFYA